MSVVSTGACPPRLAQVALAEARVRKVAELLANVVGDTKGKVERKQAQTFEEMQV
jgi:splicing factor 3A subunit 3